MQFVYFCGRDKVGKTTMALSLQQLMKQRYNLDAPIMSFADGVRDELVNLYGIPKEIIYNKSIDKVNTIIQLGGYIYEGVIPQLWKKYGLINKESEYSDIEISLRDLFVNHGTKIRRQEDDLYWFKILMNTVEMLPVHNIQYIIIDDPRSPSDFLLSKSSKIFHLYNNQESPSNLEQDRFLNWLEENEHRITSHIEVPIPLTRLNSYNKIKEHILPKIIM